MSHWDAWRSGHFFGRRDIRVRRETWYHLCKKSPAQTQSPCQYSFPFASTAGATSFFFANRLWVLSTLFDARWPTESLEGANPMQVAKRHASRAITLINADIGWILPVPILQVISLAYWGASTLHNAVRSTQWSVKKWWGTPMIRNKNTVYYGSRIKCPVKINESEVKIVLLTWWLKSLVQSWWGTSSARRSQL